MTVNESRYLMIGAAVLIAGPVFMGVYIYYFLTTTYAQQQSVKASQAWSRVLDFKPGAGR